MTIGCGQPIFDYSRRCGSHVNASTNLFGMIDQTRHPKMDWHASSEGSV